MYSDYLIDTLKAHGVAGIGYSMCTDAINIPILGGTAKAVKENKGLSTTAPLRKVCSTVANKVASIL